MDPETTPVIVAAKRTPQGKDDGSLSDVRTEDLSIAVIEALLSETGVDGDEVDDLRWGVAQQREEQDNNVARVIALLSELGEETPATTINRWCASSMETITTAADAIRAGQRQAIVAGGGENMSRVPMGQSYATVHPAIAERYNVGELQMGMTAEKVAEVYDVSREEQDRYALRSHERAHEATEEGHFDEQIVPIETDDGVVTTDEGIRPDSDFETLQSLPPVFKGDGTVTAGNASQISDGAAGVLVTSEAFAEERDLDVLAYVGSHEVVGVDPTVMGIGPVPATRALLGRTGREIDEYDLVELNEAFASQCYYAQRELSVPDDRYNVNGGAIALGHPLGASGARLPVTLVHELQRRGGNRGIATLCVGFGQGAAVEFETP